MLRKKGSDPDPETGLELQIPGNCVCVCKCLCFGAWNRIEVEGMSMTDMRHPTHFLLEKVY